MNDLIVEHREGVQRITLNRPQKHNAFDDHLLGLLQETLDEAIANPAVRVIVLGAQGEHFSAGADLAWMARMATYSLEQNLADARVLAKVMYTLHHAPKPTIAMVQGSAFGGGAGLVAACDMAFASESATFCFSEVRLGLIPAVISPYVIDAIGSRAARHLFMSAERIDASEARALGLVTHRVSPDRLEEETLEHARRIIRNAPLAISDCKRLVDDVANRPLDATMLELTAHRIAEKRCSTEGQEGMRAFLEKRAPAWNGG